MEQESVRWVVLLPAAICVLIATGIACDFIAPALGVWYDPLAGFSAAFLVVLTVSVIAPKKKVLAATVALILGGAMAWIMISPPSYFPRSYGELAYRPTYLPITVTYLGGGVAWTLSGIVATVRRKKPNKPLQPTGSAGG